MELMDAKDSKLSANSILIAVLLLVTAVFGAVVLYFHMIGSNYVLDHIQKIQPGLTGAEVQQLMNRDPQICEAANAPSWITHVAGAQESGEYWYFYMGYPPRNLIIYFDENQRVAFVTWAST